MHKLNDLLLMGAIKLQPVIMAAGLADGYQREIDRKVKQLNDLFYSLIGILGALAGGCITFFGVYFGMKYSIAKKDNAEEAKKQQQNNQNNQNSQNNQNGQNNVAVQNNGQRKRRGNKR